MNVIICIFLFFMHEIHTCWSIKNIPGVNLNSFLNWVITQTQSGSLYELLSFFFRYWIIPLHSMITLNEQDKVFMNPPVDHRKVIFIPISLINYSFSFLFFLYCLNLCSINLLQVIISTNIAESSITVPDVKYGKHLNFLSKLFFS